MAKFTKSKEQILNQIGLEILSEYEDKNIRASGRYETNTRIEREAGEPVLHIPFYTKYITEGEGSIGGYNPYAIFQWIKDKGIYARDYKTGRFQRHLQTAFMIAAKIRDQGTDIFQGKRQGMYLRTAINRGLDMKLPELVEEIVQEIFKGADFKRDIIIRL